jgi:hypothetical protein
VAWQQHSHGEEPPLEATKRSFIVSPRTRRTLRRHYWTRWIVCAAVLLGLVISLGGTLSNGIIVADGSLLHCVGPCTDEAGLVAASPGAQVYFFEDGVPVGRAQAARTPLHLPPGADVVVAEKRFGLWTGRTALEHATPDLDEPPQSAAPQRVDVQIDPGDVHFVVHVLLPRTDVRGQAYLDEGYGLTNLVDLLTPLSIDGAWISSARDLGFDNIVLTPTTFAMDVRGSVAQRDLAAAVRGAHRIVVGHYAENPVDLHVGLRGEGFAHVQPFDRAPNLIAGLGDASWTHLRPDDAVTVWAEPTAPVPFPQRLRTIAAAVAGSTVYPLLFLLLIAWQIVGILVTIRLTPFGARRSLVRAAFAMVSTCATLGFGYLAVVIGTFIPGGAPPLVVLALALVAIGLVYILAGRTERPMIGTRPAVAIATMFLLEYVAFRYETALAQSPPNPAWLGESFLSLATFALASAIGLIAFAPRLLVLAAHWNARWARAAYVAGVLAVVLSAALWRPLYPGDASHYRLPIAFGEPYAAGFEVLSNVVIVALPIIGLLALICAARGQRPSIRGTTFAGIVVLLALWCIGLDGPAPSFPPALIALASIPLFALRPRAACEALSQHLLPLGSTSDSLFKEAALRADLDVATRSLRQLRERFLGGELDFATYNTRSLELTQFIANESRGLSPALPQAGATTMFAAFTLQDPIRSARQASYVGALLSAVTAFVGFDALKGSLSVSSLSVLVILAWSLHLIARGAVAAFVFVYFLPYLRGGMATTKGLFLSIAFVLAIAPTALLLETWEHALATLITAALFFPVVGAVLDTIGLVQHAESVSMMRLFSFANFRTLAAIGTVLITAIASTVTGQLSQAAATFVGVAVHAPAAVGNAPLSRAP